MGECVFHVNEGEYEWEIYISMKDKICQDRALAIIFASEKNITIFLVEILNLKDLTLEIV